MIYINIYKYKADDDIDRDVDDRCRYKLKKNWCINFGVLGLKKWVIVCLGNTSQTAII